jgi:hypothetical protein
MSKSRPEIRRGTQIWYNSKGVRPGMSMDVTTADGEVLQYKFHIALDPSTYMTGPKPSRDIVVSFLTANGIHFKCGGSNKKESYMDTKSDQYGKMFTIYATTKEQFYIVAKGMQQLVKKYNLQGISQADLISAGANQQYELSIPETNNTLYYTVERTTPGAVFSAIRALHPKWIIKDDTDSFGNPRMIVHNPKFTTGQVGINYGHARDTNGNKIEIGPEFVQGLYLGGEKNPESYSLRESVLKHYMGEGPVDFLF